KPNVKYYDPDTFEIVEMDIPACMEDISVEKYGIHVDFMQGCYPEGTLKERISEKEKEKIQTLLKDVAYQTFLEELDCKERGEADE
ncbi:MAG: hypothetical protein LGB78_06050, partial [Sulfurovum sp.]|nr:hypothetical protein [Sulfurovum sp.]